MSKKKSFRSPFSRQGKTEVQQACEQADELIHADRPQEAIALLKPLLQRYPNWVELYYYLGFASTQVGDAWDAAFYYQRIQQLERDPELWPSLGFLYLELDLKALALQAFRYALRYKLDSPAVKEIPMAVEVLEEELRIMSEMVSKPVDVCERGLRLLEEGQIALQQQAYANCIHLNQKSIRLLGDWPPPHNNLSLAFFFMASQKKLCSLLAKCCRTILIIFRHWVISSVFWHGRCVQMKPAYIGNT